MLSRYVRSQMLEVIHMDYIRTARAKGLSEDTVIYKHGLRNALLPFITMFGLIDPRPDRRFGHNRNHFFLAGIGPSGIRSNHEPGLSRSS